MMESIDKFSKLYEDHMNSADPRTKDWLLINRSPVYITILSVIYLLFIWQGPKWMKSRQPFQLKNFLIVYNIGLVILSLYMALELAASTYNAKYSLTCAEYNSESYKNPAEYRVAAVIWWYFFSKAIEFMDTVLMVLRKKNNQITFLHVYHHVSMLHIWFWATLFIPGGQSWFGPFMNSMIHVLMYTYYAAAAVPALRPYLWWKKYLTKLQLLQFCIVITHTVGGIVLSCDMPKRPQWFLTSYMISLVVLFTNFYIKSYKSQKVKVDTRSIETNGTSESLVNGKQHISAETHSSINGHTNLRERSKKSH